VENILPPKALPSESCVHAPPAPACKSKVIVVARVATIVNVPLSVNLPLTSVALTVKFAVLVVPVGVPEIKPVEDKDNPGFKLPEARE
jgi:hypothetical protein